MGRVVVADKCSKGSLRISRYVHVIKVMLHNCRLLRWASKQLLWRWSCVCLRLGTWQLLIFSIRDGRGDDAHHTCHNTMRELFCQQACLKSRWVLSGLINFFTPGDGCVQSSAVMFTTASRALPTSRKQVMLERASAMKSSVRRSRVVLASVVAHGTHEGVERSFESWDGSANKC